MEISQSREPWNKGKLIGQKPPLKLKDIWDDCIPVVGPTGCHRQQRPK